MSNHTRQLRKFQLRSFGGNRSHDPAIVGLYSTNRTRKAVAGNKTVYSVVVRDFMTQVESRASHESNRMLMSEKKHS